ncbi:MULTISPECIES: universal stress protein [unclassified Lentimicrobium]|uniref:universal stress protein n=1 Tax=unclassified Lentimicrobium TaxID=2677434 RepID=UPI0015530C35|nr:MULTISPECIES: universal stress protein [unclassified Lentimicrobium]NPD45790.1 universal stress protein [Lentimicrobium sp. S6]NPD84805.1 universal stress protein [Lentimicrobium sp. L6]
MSKTILIPTDFSKVCNNAINHGAEIARSIGARIVLLHVINADSLAFLKKNSFNNDYIETQLNDLRTQLEQSYGIIVQTIKVEGKLVASISNVSKEVQADMVVFGTHGKTGIQKITGGHAMKVIHGLDIPILVVQKRTFGMGYRKIVFPINISTSYSIKIDWTIFIATAFQAEVFIYIMKTEEAYIQKAMLKLVDEITNTFKTHQIPYTIDQAQSAVDFPKQINKYAEEQNADLIMIKVDNDEFEPSFILGAIEEKTIYNNSNIPVFCAQNKEEI